MLRLLEDPRAMFVALILLATVVLGAVSIDNIIEARRAEEKKETIDKFIDLAKEGIHVWTPN